MPYRKVILKAVDELRDCHMRSSIDAIYRYVESNLPDGVDCNYPLFLNNLKSLAEDGDLELSHTHCGLTPEYKKRRVSKYHARAGKIQTTSHSDGGTTMDLIYPMSQHCVGHPKHKSAREQVLHRYSWNNYNSLMDTVEP